MPLDPSSLPPPLRSLPRIPPPDISPLNFHLLFLVLPCGLPKNIQRFSRTLPSPLPPRAGLGKISQTGLCCKMRKLDWMLFYVLLGSKLQSHVSGFSCYLSHISKCSPSAKLSRSPRHSVTTLPLYLCACCSLLPGPPSSLSCSPGEPFLTPPGFCPSWYFVPLAQHMALLCQESSRSRTSPHVGLLHDTQYEVF